MRNFAIDDFDAGQYLLRMCPSEIFAQKHDKPYTYTDTFFLATLIKKIGWITNNYNIGDGTTIYTLTDLSDGMTRISNYTAKEPNSNNYEKVIWQGENGLGKQKIIDWLNNPELSQEHRYATQEEIMRVLLIQSQNKRLFSK